MIATALVVVVAVPRIQDRLTDAERVLGLVALGVIASAHTHLRRRVEDSAKIATADHLLLETTLQGILLILLMMISGTVTTVLHHLTEIPTTAVLLLIIKVLHLVRNDDENQERRDATKVLRVSVF